MPTYYDELKVNMRTHGSRTIFFTRFTIQAARGVDPSRLGDVDEEADCTEVALEDLKYDDSFTLAIGISFTLRFFGISWCRLVHIGILGIAVCFKRRVFVS